MVFIQELLYDGREFPTGVNQGVDAAPFVYGVLYGLWDSAIVVLRDGVELRAGGLRQEIACPSVGGGECHLASGFAECAYDGGAWRVGAVDDKYASRQGYGQAAVVGA